MSPAAPITDLLRAWSRGDATALRELIPLTYDELRDIARGYIRRQRGQTLETAGLLNEAYLRFASFGEVDWQDRRHFLAVSAQLMRRILVDHARAAKAQKRGGLQMRVTLTERNAGAASSDVDLLALDEALAALERLDSRKVRVVELRFFAGFDVNNTADLLRVSRETVLRDWKFTQAWLLRHMTSF